MVSAASLAGVILAAIPITALTLALVAAVAIFATPDWNWPL